VICCAFDVLVRGELFSLILFPYRCFSSLKPARVVYKKKSLNPTYISLFLLLRFISRSTGAARILANSFIATESVSVRIAVPMDMKKLFFPSVNWLVRCWGRCRTQM